MVAYKNILYATTKLIKNNFDCDVFVEDSEGLFNNECFYVQLIPITSSEATKTTNLESLMISVKYFNNDKIKNYEVANILKDLFSRTLKVNNKYLYISSTEPNFGKDEVGNMLDFLIYLNYVGKIKQDLEEFDNMENINMEMRG